MADLPDDFWLDAAVFLCQKSLRNLRLCLAHHLRWLGERGKCWRSAACEDLRRYLGALIDNGLADATLGLYRWALVWLYDWAHRNRHRPDNPVVRLAPMKRQPRSLRWVPTKEQVERILHAPDVRTKLGVRDRCILELLYATGMRASELLGLQAWQVDRQCRHFLVMGKGQRERLVIYGEVAAEWLEQYLYLARPHLIAGSGCDRGTSTLFVHPVPGQVMNYMNLWRMVRRHGDTAGLPLMTPHVLRHAFATHCHDSGMDLITLQTLLGHVSVTTTTIYLRSSMEWLRAFLERHHPRCTNYHSYQLLKRRS